MATRRGASISQKMILTSTALVLVLIGMSGAISALNTRRIFDDAAGQLAELHTSSLKRRGEVQTGTMVETARTALMQSDYSTLKTFVPAAAKNDTSVVAIYIVADTGIVAAHSDPRLSERPVAEVDPVLGARMVEVSRSDSFIIPPPSVPDKTLEPEGSPSERRFVFASPVTASGRKLGTLVVIYSLHELDAALARIEADRIAAGRDNLFRTVILGILFMLVGTMVSVFQALRITRPIKQLSLRADQIARGDLDTRVEITSQDEIGLLGENFNYMADRLQVLLQETAAKATLEKELEVARAIQETLVPSADPIDRSIVRLAGYFQPATQCGGDWWTVHDLPDNKLLVVIGDVTGHGVPSAMITAAAKAACDVVRALEGPTLTSGRLLSIMNRAIYESAKRKFVMTCFVSIIDMSRRTISYSNAGHNFPYLYRMQHNLRPGENEFTVLMSRGNRLGDLQESNYAETEATLRPGDVLVFYTDGIVECENALGEEYGEKRFRGAIRNAADQEPAQMRDSVVAAASVFYGDRPRKDDITLVMARIR